MTKNLYCDNYSTCHSLIIAHETDGVTEGIARAKGWHIFHGFSESGKSHDHVLCDKCVGTNRSRLPRAPELLSGQLELDI